MSPCSLCSLRFIFSGSVTKLYRPADALTLFDVDQLVRLNILQRVNLPARPANLQHVDSLSLPQPEVNAQIILREVAATAAHFIDLLMGFRLSGQMCHTHQPRPDSAAVRFRSNRTNLDPVVIQFQITTEQLRITIHGIDDHIDISIVIEIAKCRAPRGTWL